jgi:hypothetical protein
MKRRVPIRLILASCLTLFALPEFGACPWRCIERPQVSYCQSGAGLTGELSDCSVYCDCQYPEPCTGCWCEGPQCYWT